MYSPIELKVVAYDLRRKLSEFKALKTELENQSKHNFSEEIKKELCRVNEGIEYFQELLYQISQIHLNPERNENIQVDV